MSLISLFSTLCCSYSCCCLRGAVVGRSWIDVWFGSLLLINLGLISIQNLKVIKIDFEFKILRMGERYLRIEGLINLAFSCASDSA